MGTITLDVESYYSQDFSLGKMTTEAYIRSPEFEVIGFSYSLDGSEPRWVTGNDDYIGDRLRQLELHKHNLVCHNTAFDGAVLAWRYGVVPKYYFDTLSMARPLHNNTKVGGSLAKLAQHYELGEKGKEVIDAKGKRRSMFTAYDLAQYGEYCKNDVMLTWQLFQKLRPHIPKKELYLIDLFIRMYTQPVLQLDKDLLESHYSRVKESKQKLLDKIRGVDPAVFMSNDKFAKILRHLGVEPPMKVSPATSRQSYAFAKTDPQFKALQEHSDPRVQAVVAARLGVKSTLEETRTQSLIGVAERGPLPIMLQYYGAATGRCLVGGTKIIVTRGDAIKEINLRDLEDDDLVWDGENFVQHGGLIAQGLKEVISHDGVTGTPDHTVFTEDGTLSLSEAMRRKVRITSARVPEGLTNEQILTKEKYARTSV